jgi:hypothetical protein
VQRKTRSNRVILCSVSGSRVEKVCVIQVAVNLTTDGDLRALLLSWVLVLPEGSVGFDRGASPYFFLYVWLLALTPLLLLLPPPPLHCRLVFKRT